MHFATAASNFSASELPKVVPDRQFLTFSLPNVLFATAACNFWCHLSAPTSAPAALTGLLLDWPDTRIYEKTQHFVTSLTFGACVSSFLLTFWLLHLLSTDLTTLLLLFNSPYCRKFLFKLPSIITLFICIDTLYRNSGTIECWFAKHVAKVYCMFN